MLKTLAWVSTLGIVGLVLFGSTGGSILGAVGYAIGSHLSQSSNFATVDREPVDESRDPYRNEYSPSKHRGLISLLCLIIAGLVWINWPDRSDGEASAIPVMEESPTRKIPDGLGPVWSTEDCMQSHFGNALNQGMQAPPVARMYCAYPWDHKALQSIIDILRKNQLESDAIFDNLQNPDDNSSLSREILKQTRKLPMPEGLHELHELSQLLPLLWAVRKDNYKTNSKVLTGLLKPEFIRQLKKASAALSWEQNVALSMIHAIPLGARLDVMLYTSRYGDVSLADLSGVIYAMSSFKENVNAESTAGRNNVIDDLIYRRARQGISSAHILPLALLDFHMMYLQMTAEHLQASPGLPGEWKPANKPQRTAAYPLQIYLLPVMPKEMCGAAMRFETGVFCSDTDQIFVPIETDSKRKIDITAQMFHEAAHAFLNPTRQDEFPFATEGIATAYGERIYRATKAAFKTSQLEDPRRLKSFVDAIFRTQEPQPVASPEAQSVADAQKFAKVQLAKQPPTRMAKRALCRLQERPPTLKAVQRYLSMSNGTFRSLSNDDLAVAYAYAWGIFHYGVDVGEIGLGTEGDQLDATVIQSLATGIVRNEAPTDQQGVQINKFLKELSHRASMERTKWKMKC